MPLDWNLSCVRLSPNDITVTPTIVNRAVYDTAPEAVWFDATISGQDAAGPGIGETYDARKHDCYYFWDFYYSGVDNSYTYARPTKVNSVHRNSRYAYGPYACHVYREPGTYTVRLTVIEPSSGKSGVGTVSVTVGAEDDLFPTTQTIYMDPTSTWANSPAGATQVTYTAINTALAAIDAQETTPYRIMLAAGQTFTLNEGQYGNGTDIPSFRIVAAAGTRPTVNITSGIQWNDKTALSVGGKEVVIRGIDFEGGWDPLTASGNETGLWTSYQNGPKQVLIDDCNMNGMSIAVFTPDTDPDRSHRQTILNDCTVSDWRSYGMLEGDRFGTSILGSKFAMNPDAYTDATDSGGACSRQGGDFEYTILHSSEFFSVCGWSGTAGGSLAEIASMPPLRLRTQGGTNGKGNIQCCYVEGGRDGMTFNAGTGTDPNTPWNCIVDKNVIISNYHTLNLVATQHSGMSFRNNILIFSRNVGAQVELDPEAFFKFNNSVGGVSNDEPINAYFNTCVNVRDIFRGSGTAAALTAVTGFNNVNTGGNVLHQTDTSTTQLAYAPLADAANEWTPYNKGYHTVGFIDNDGSGQIADLRLASATELTAGLYDDYIPETTSSAIGAETTGFPADDFYGNLRIDVVAALTRTGYTAGAHEPSLES